MFDVLFADLNDFTGTLKISNEVNEQISRKQKKTGEADFTESKLCRLFSSDGRLIVEQRLESLDGKARLALPDLAPGLYIVQADRAWGRFVRE